MLETEQRVAEEKRRKLAAFFTDAFYGITSEPHSKGRSNRNVVVQLLAAGIRIIQYREKEKSTGEKYEEALILQRLTREAGALFIVNDDPGLAAMVKADGVHLGQDDYPLPAVRSLLGPECIIGLSTHSPEQAVKAAAAGADYIGVGPLFPTRTKQDVCPAVGLDYLEYAVNHINLPLVAIGGIKEHNLAEVLACGAKCVAMVTELVGAESISGKIHSLRRKAAKYWDTVQYGQCNTE